MGPDGEEGGLELPAGERDVDVEWGGGGAPRRSTPADRAARAKRGRGDSAVANEVVPGAPPPKRQQGCMQVGKSGRHGVTELDYKHTNKATPWLKWRAELSLPGRKVLHVGDFATADDAAQAYDAEVRRRGWAHVKPLNFPQPEELTAYTLSVERCDERGLPLSLAPELTAATQGAAATEEGASGQWPLTLSAKKPGKSGFFCVSKDARLHKAAKWQATVYPIDTKNKKYVVGHFTTKEEAARAYDAEVRRRGWAHLKRLNFPEPEADATLPPSSAAVGAPGSE